MAKCQRLVTRLDEMEVIDISPLLFLSFLLSLSLQNMVKPYSLQQGTAKPRRAGWPSQGGLVGQAKKGGVAKPRRAEQSWSLFPGGIFLWLTGTRPALPPRFWVPHHDCWWVLELSSAIDARRTLGRSRQTSVTWTLSMAGGSRGAL